MSRFVDLNDKEIDELIENKDSKSTKRAINNAKKLFLEYALTKGKTEEDVEKMTAVDLDNLLYGFYPSTSWGTRRCTGKQSQKTL